MKPFRVDSCVATIPVVLEAAQQLHVPCDIAYSDRPTASRASAWLM
jgi:hypothetical protein